MASTEVRLDVETVPFADGAAFGAVGPYERLRGKVAFALDPADPALPYICDLDLAPRNAAGRIEFQADFDLLKPVEPARGNRRLFYEASNRGGRATLRMFNDAGRAAGGEAGNGFMMRRGYSVLWCGWQGDLLSRGGNMVAYLPKALQNGEPVRGRVCMEFVVDKPGVLSQPVSGEPPIRCYPVLDRASATLTVREREQDPRVPVPDAEWELARAERDPESGAVTVTPSNIDLHIKDGFRPGWIYELIYDTAGSRVYGLGLVGIRDILSFLRYAEADAAGRPNPLRGAVERVYGWGSSLSARTIRQLVYEGLNLDPAGRRIFDGIYSHSASGGRLFLNQRFAQIGRFPRQHEDHAYPSERFPFTYMPATDPFSGRTDSILKRPASDPLVIHTHSSSDYWQRYGSLGHTDPASGEDLTLSDNVRMYYLTGALHAGGETAGGEGFIGQLPANSTNQAPFLRACLTLLDRWVSEGTPPPPSRLPRRAEGTLAPPAEVLARFPRIPGVNLPAGPSRLPLWDYGPDFDRGFVSQHPPTPVPGCEYPVQVPQVNADGNEVAGLCPPDVAVPLGTYTGWNLRQAGYAEGELLSMNGGFVPFARTRAERLAADDPRPSLEERYGDHAGYVAAVTRAVDALVADGLLLAEDGERYVDAARRKNPFDPAVPLRPLL